MCKKMENIAWILDCTTKYIGPDLAYRFDKFDQSSPSLELHSLGTKRYAQKGTAKYWDYLGLLPPVRLIADNLLNTTLLC
jgi:hypothetical protein